MRTWIFEVMGNQAAIYGFSALTGALILHRKVHYHSRAGETRVQTHERLLRCIAREVALACSAGADARYVLRGPKPDVQVLKNLVRQVRLSA